MSINTAKYFGPVVPVRYLMSDLQIAGASENDYLYPLLYTYAVRCEEKLEGHVRPGTQEVVFEMSERAQKAFAVSVGKFSEKFAPVIRSWSVRDPSGIARLFGCFLEAGNYPADSPYVVRRKLMDKLSVFREVFASQAEDIKKNMPVEIMHYQTTHEEIERIKTELDERLLEDDEQVALSRIVDLLDSKSPEDRQAGVGLIVLLSANRNEKPELPTFFIEIAEISKGFDPLQWRSGLAHAFSGMVMKRSIYDLEWEWEDALEGAVISAARGTPFVYRSKFDLPFSSDERMGRVYRSLLALLGKGEIDLAQRFILEITKWGAPSVIQESLLHISVFAGLDNVGLQLVDRALSISESNDQNGLRERPLADHIAALLAYDQHNPELEYNLLRLVDKLSYQRISATTFHDEDEDEFVAGFIRAVLNTYDGLIKKGTMHDERKRRVSESAAAKALEIAAKQKLNHIREFLLKNALSDIRNGGANGGWDYLEPMMLPEEQERIDNTDQNPYSYLKGFLDRKKKAGFQGGGGASPAGDSSAPAGGGGPGMGAQGVFSPAVMNNGVFSNTAQTSALLFAGSPVISAVNFSVTGGLGIHF